MDTKNLETNPDKKPDKKSETAKDKDRILYCERCGISFLYSREEQELARSSPQSTDSHSGEGTGGQRSPANVPDLCPGCRKLVPQPERERGLVKWFNRRRHYGFIMRRSDPDIFVHGSNVDLSDAEDRRALQPGDLVEFSVEEGDKGLIATSVRFLWHSSDENDGSKNDT